jgi:xanthine dehydrogenase small subunit
VAKEWGARVVIKQGAAIKNSPAVWMPVELKSAWQLKQQFGEDACFIAGGTLLQTYWQKGLDCPPHLISLEGIKELQGWGKEIVNKETVTRLGALTTLEYCRNHPKLLEEVPLLVEAVRNIAAPAIRNKATIGGNIANGMGDTIPALLVIGTILSLFDGNQFHYKTLWEYILERNSLSDSILICAYFPDKTLNNKKNCFYKKIGLREAFSPSIVTISGCCQLNSKREVEYIRLAVGGGSIPSQRLVECEQLLKGITLSDNQLKKAVQVIKEELISSADAFFSKDYKKTVAANMIVSEIVRLVG